MGGQRYYASWQNSSLSSFSHKSMRVRWSGMVFHGPYDINMTNEIYLHVRNAQVYTSFFYIMKNNSITSTSNDLMKSLSIYTSNNVFNGHSKQIEAY